MAQIRSRWALAMSVCVLCFASPVVADIGVARALGRPEFKEGKALGYFVWKDGDTWKVRWTTFGAEHRFNGRVTLEGGSLSDFHRVDPDTERRVVRPGRAARRGPRGRVIVPGRAPVVASRQEDHIEQETERIIRFSARTDDDIDGFDFKVTGATDQLRFVLEIDGKARPQEVEVGRENLVPNENPLVIRLR